jgi:ubiquinone biosynthesis protein
LRRFDGRIQPQLILLQKTLFNIEGLGRQLYPELDIWKTATPILEAWARDTRHPVAVAKRLWKRMPELLEVVEQLPTALRYAAQQASEPNASPDARAAAQVAAHRQAPSGTQRRDGRVAAALVLLSGILAWGSPGIPPAVGLCLSVIGTAWLIREVLRCD